VYVDPHPLALRVHETRGQFEVSEFVKKLAQVLVLMTVWPDEVVE
jgi:hypothetical protein